MLQSLILCMEHAPRCVPGGVHELVKVLAVHTMFLKYQCVCSFSDRHTIWYRIVTRKKLTNPQQKSWKSLNMQSLDDWFKLACFDRNQISDNHKMWSQNSSNNIHIAILILKFWSKASRVVLEINIITNTEENGTCVHLHYWTSSLSTVEYASACEFKWHPFSDTFIT